MAIRFNNSKIEKLLKWRVASQKTNNGSPSPTQIEIINIPKASWWERIIAIATVIVLIVSMVQTCISQSSLEQAKSANEMARLSMVSNDSNSQRSLRESLRMFDSSQAAGRKNDSIMYEHLSVMKQEYIQAKKSAQVAEKSMLIAKQDLSLNERGTKLQHRAFLIMDSIAANPAYYPRLKFLVYLKNFGKTPAYKVIVHVQPIYDAGQPDSKWDFLSYSADFNPFITIPANTSYLYDFNIFPGNSFNSKEHEKALDFLEGKAFMMVKIKVVYEDIFKNKHTLKYLYNWLNKDDKAIFMEDFGED